MEHFERYGRPVRIAIDVSIWSFQIQSGKGGSNPALRTLYYRLLRLLSLSIQPLFVFDGANKPPFKRNVKTTPHTASLPNFLTKELFKLFGFPFHTAPGEAEAECAILQKEGIVDAVLSEDVDTLMFGSGLTMRNWSSEGTRGNKSPTHVNLYEAQATKNGKSGLDSDGMILVALMSGGDYIPAGIPGCGIKIACQAARAGFGEDLCKLSRKDSVGLGQFRERLQYELQTNKSGYFRTRHKALHIPDTFPDKAVLGYYTHPAVSSKDKLAELKESIRWNIAIDIPGLRTFVAEAFEWQTISGAKKFIRGLAPSLLIHKLLQRGMAEMKNDDLEITKFEEASLITAVHTRRTHFINDGMPELRVEYTPLNVVGLDLTKEDSEHCNGGYDSLSDGEGRLSDDCIPSRSQSPTKPRAPSQYDPTRLEKIWILETYAKMGIPLMVEAWEGDVLKPKKPTSRKPRQATAKLREKITLKKGGTKHGALDAFVKITKSGAHAVDPGITIVNPNYFSSAAPPPTFLVSSLQAISGKEHADFHLNLSQETIRDPQKQKPSSNAKKLVAESKLKAPSENALMTPPKDSTINPWTLSRRPSDTFSPRLPKGARYSALGIYGPPLSDNEDVFVPEGFSQHYDRASPSPPSPSSKIGHKHMRSLSPLTRKDREDHSKNSTISYNTPEKKSQQSIHLSINDNTCQPSPRKPKTTPKPPRSGFSTQHPITPTSTKSTTHPPQPKSYTPPNPSSSTANRRLFDSQINPIHTSPASPSSLPSPSSLLSPKLVTPPTPESVILPPPSNIFASESKAIRRFIALRESLEGAWKRVDDDLAVRLPKTYAGVEVVDLTGN